MVPEIESWTRPLLKDPPTCQYSELFGVLLDDESRSRDVSTAKGAKNPLVYVGSDFRICRAQGSGGAGSKRKIVHCHCNRVALCIQGADEEQQTQSYDRSSISFDHSFREGPPRVTLRCIAFLLLRRRTAYHLHQVAGVELFGKCVLHVIGSERHILLRRNHRLIQRQVNRGVAEQLAGQRILA